MGYDRRLWVGVWARGSLYLWTALQLALLALSLSAPSYNQAAGAAAGAIAIVVVISSIVTAIFVWLWIYRAMTIAHEVIPSLTISPGWAVGWYFVPVACLWKPYQAMSEISDGSQNGDNWDEVIGSLIGWWWAMWLIFNVTNRLPDVLGVTFLLVNSIAGIAAAVLLAEIIRRITARYAHAVDASIFA